MTMMPYDWPWPSPQLKGHAAFWHPTRPGRDPLSGPRPGVPPGELERRSSTWGSGPATVVLLYGLMVIVTVPFTELP
jgi:hypothetical protein